MGQMVGLACHFVTGGLRGDQPGHGQACLTCPSAAASRMATSNGPDLPSSVMGLAYGNLRDTGPIGSDLPLLLISGSDRGFLQVWPGR